MITQLLENCGAGFHHPSTFRVAVLLLLVLSQHIPLSAQEVIDDCGRDCPSIAVDTLLTIGDEADPVLLDYMTWNGIIGGPNGLFYAGENLSEGVVAVYNRDGSLLRTLGRPGAGPGEFRAPQTLLGPAGGIWIQDPANARVTPITDSLKLGDSFRLAGNIVSSLALDGDSVLVNGTVSTAPDARRPFHVLDPNGTPIRSFGLWPETTVRGFSAIARKPGSGRTFWNLLPNEYLLREWSLSGEIERTLRRDVEWFEEPWTTEFDWDDPYMLHLSVDSAGRLWVLARIGVTGEVPRSGYVDSWNDSFDLLIEVIDPEERRVVARRRFEDATLRPLPGTNLFYAARQTRAGYIFLDIVRLTIPERLG